MSNLHRLVHFYSFYEQKIYLYLSIYKNLFFNLWVVKTLNLNISEQLRMVVQTYNSEGKLYLNVHIYFTRSIWAHILGTDGILTFLFNLAKKEQ